MKLSEPLGSVALGLSLWLLGAGYGVTKNNAAVNIQRQAGGEELMLLFSLHFFFFFP